MTKQKNDPLEARKRLTFKQAEGIDPLPTQLKRGEISKEFRAALWAVVHHELDRARWAYEDDYLTEPWDSILRDVHVLHDRNAVDEFPSHYYDLVDKLKRDGMPPRV